MVACIAKVGFNYRGRLIAPGEKLILAFDDASNLLFLELVKLEEEKAENVGNSPND